MSYQEKNASVMLFSALIIAVYYVISLLRIFQAEQVNPNDVYALWATVVVVSILTTIASTILTNIIFSIIAVIRTGEEDEDFFMDERDKLIELTGNRNAYNVFGIGAFFSMLSFVVGMDPLVMFIVLVGSGIAAQITENLTQLYLYRRGF